MKKLLAAALLAAFCTAPASAAWWMENDYAFGDGGLKKNSLTLFRRNSKAFTSALNASFYRDKGPYNKNVYSFRTPLMYSAPKYFLSLKPFIYPSSGHTDSGAYGGKLYLLTSLAEEDDQSYARLVLSGAWARQKALLNGTRKEFSQSAFELQVEKSFYGQFFFLASGAGFPKPGGGVRNTNLTTPALDQSDLAYLGVFRHVTALPEWVLTAQVARNMQPEYDSHLYAGYSKISFRQLEKANSLTGGIKLNLNETSTLDMAYNAYKQENSSWKNYYKLLLQLSF